MTTDLAVYVPPSATELRETWKLAEQLAKTEFAAKPMRDKPEAVLACILTGRELGIGPMQALRDVYLVNGRPSLAATLMVARVRAAGHRFRTCENTDALATVQIHRKGEREPEPPVTFTLDDARRAKLASKDIWQQYPGRMCWARAASAACRRDAPEVLGGVVYTPEELDGGPATTVTADGFEVDRDTGELLDGPTGELLDGPAGGGAAPPTSPAAFRAELEAEQREGAGRRRHFEAAVAAQASGAGEREPASHAESDDGEVAGDVRDNPAPDSVPPQPDADFPRAGGAATAVRVSDLAKAYNRRISDARELLERDGFAGVTGVTVLSGDALARARKALAEGGDGS